MNPRLLLRLFLDFTAMGLLVFSLSYWWLGNVAHEVAGTTMFLLLIVHNTFNRRWYGRIPSEGRRPRGVFNITVTLLLLVSMLALLVTSVLISEALSDVMSAVGGFTVRQIHTVAAYWVLVIVGVHLGLRWPMLMGVARSLLGIKRPSLFRTMTLRAAAAGVAALGVWSASAIGLGTKLSMQVSLDWWHFEEAVVGFFVHCVAILGLCITLTHYGLRGAARLAAPPVNAAGAAHPPAG